MTTQNDVRVTIRVDKNLKERAEDLFERLGLNMTTAFNVFLRKAVDEEAIPFTVSTKSAVFSNGYTVNDITKAFAGTVKTEIVEKMRKGFPIARYDSIKKQAYLEYPDGTLELDLHHYSENRPIRVCSFFIERSRLSP